ncbi:tyrosine-type recombinase/integrase [Sphingomonas faeni]|uniref:tyrosine-type recombinase/integrase n=1 Tax=Sphingomonas faeni TaxID=185950 RepID=UPI00278794E3|nr:site-specific integrase [Sphingomonas faeni]MDQ0839417.1 integrase [Sphingomonas faeni]
MGKLTTLTVKNAKAGRHADGAGLYLLVKPSGARSWLLRVQQDGTRRDVGLGAVDLTPKRDKDEENAPPLLNRRILSLTEAREKATLLRKFTKAGLDPIVERDRERKKVPTFQEAAIACHAELKGGWTAKHAASFLASLNEHAYGLLGKHRVDTIEASHVRDTLAPIWQDIPVMARKVRQRIGTVLHFAKSKGWRTSEPPGASVTMGLARQGRGGHFPAMPYADVPALMAALRAAPPTTGRTALMLTILTAARSGETRFTRWGHFDLEKRLWNRPADIMKEGEAHTVTLNEPAMAILRSIKPEDAKPDQLVFAGKSGKVISDMTMIKVLRDSGISDAVHGFRSSLRDWAAEKMPHVPDPVAEAAISHKVSDQVIAAYKRTKFIDMRRDLLEAWGEFVTGRVSQNG